jgi:hypothetical protein
MSIRSIEQTRKINDAYIESVFSDDVFLKERTDYCVKLYSNSQGLDSFLKIMDPIINQMQSLNIHADQHTNTLTCSFVNFVASVIMPLPKSLRENISPNYGDRENILNEYKSIPSFNEKYIYVSTTYSKTCNLLISYIPARELRLIENNNNIAKNSNRNTMLGKIKRLFHR